MKKAFCAIDDWSYGYVDLKNLKRFLVGMGYRHPSAHKKNWKKAKKGGRKKPVDP
jgi:hypothetical protein